MTETLPSAQIIAFQRRRKQPRVAIALSGDMFDTSLPFHCLSLLAANAQEPSEAP